MRPRHVGARIRHRPVGGRRRRGRHSGGDGLAEAVVLDEEAAVVGPPRRDGEAGAARRRRVRRPDAAVARVVLGRTRRLHHAHITHGGRFKHNHSNNDTLHEG